MPNTNVNFTLCIETIMYLYYSYFNNFLLSLLAKVKVPQNFITFQNMKFMLFIANSTTIFTEALIKVYNI